MLSDISVRIFRAPLTLFSYPSAIERTLKAAEQTKKLIALIMIHWTRPPAFFSLWTYFFTPFFPPWTTEIPWLNDLAWTV